MAAMAIIDRSIDIAHHGTSGQLLSLLGGSSTYGPDAQENALVKFGCLKHL